LGTIFILSTAFIRSVERYDEELVEISTAIFKSERYHMVTMKREGNRIKAKYFAAKDPYSGKTVPERFKTWKTGRNVIAVSSGTYMTDCSPSMAKPVGLCIDNGIIVNNNLEDKLGGLVIVYQTGGIVATKIADGNLNIRLSNGASKIIDIKNQFDRRDFVRWAEEQEATVFQSHLLVYNDQLNSSPCKTSECQRRDKRRFLAVCKNEEGKLVHVIIHNPTESTLYEGSSKVFKFLKEFKDMEEVVYMINLDTGCQDVFDLYNSDGKKRQDVGGYYIAEQAVNLLVYYYE
jgi:hypothetical protein